MKKIWGILFGLAALVAVLLLAFPYSVVEKEMNDQKIYRIDIILNDVSYDEIINGDKNTKYHNNILKLSDGENTFSLSNVTIKGRGNSTWSQDKKPFQIEFENKISLFGMKKNKKWVLLANALDDSNLRNDTAFYIESMLDDKNAMKENPVALYINNESKGLYFLTHKINRGLVGIKKDDGILVELDNLNNDRDICYYTKKGSCLILKDWAVDDIAEDAMKKFVRDFEEIEENAKRGDWDALNRIIDVKSFAEYFLLAEFTVNPDAYASSLYFYRDGVDDEIHVGPGWDFDYAFANERWGWESDYQADPVLSMAGRDRGLIFNLFYDLIDIPEFENEVKNVFREKMGGRKYELIREVRNRQNLIRDVAKQNNEMWELNDFDDSVDELVEWVKKRYDFFENEFGGWTSRDMI